MKGGRLKKEEQGKRFRVLAGFIFNFRYATLRQIHTFAQSIMKLSYARRLIDYSIKYGYLDSYFDTTVNIQIYYLTEKGKNLIKDDEILAGHYLFRKASAGVNTFRHHNMVVQIYFFLKARLDIKEWISEEVVRIGKKRREKIPDAVILLSNGLKIALEAESQSKKFSVLRSLVMRYRYDIEKASRYDVCLVVAFSEDHYNGLKRKFLNIGPDFFNTRIILADMTMLEQGVCFYQNESRRLEDALSLLKKG